MDNLRPKWYCVRTQPKHEHIAAASLRRRLGLEVFHPRLRIERATQRGPVRVVEPLFPCYVFACCSLEKSLDEIRYVNGVSSLVHFGSRVAVVPDPVIEELRLQFPDETPMLVENDLKPGTEVLVAAGAFLGARGVVVRFLPAKQRVQILLEFLGRTTLADIEKRALAVEGGSVADLVPSLALTASNGAAVPQC